jgi:plastocyanin
MLGRTKLNLTLALVALFITACSFGGDAAISEQPASTMATPASHMSGMNMAAKQPSQMSGETATANANEVIIQNFSFEPATLTVKAGTRVTWVNRDDDPHTATDTEKRFGSKALDTGDRFSTEFTKPGTYNYYCALHPKMTGQIIVK